MNSISATGDVLGRTAVLQEEAYLCCNIQNVSLLVNARSKYHIFFALDFSVTCHRFYINRLLEGPESNFKKEILERRLVVSLDP
jgi:hypothetical protein